MYLFIHLSYIQQLNSKVPHVLLESFDRLATLILVLYLIADFFLWPIAIHICLHIPIF